MRKIIITLFIALAVSGCDQRNLVNEYLTEQGMTEIKTGGYDLSSCTAADIYAIPFEAVKESKKIAGVLCADMRFDRPYIVTKKKY